MGFSTISLDGVTKGESQEREDLRSLRVIQKMEVRELRKNYQRKQDIQ